MKLIQLSAFLLAQNVFSLTKYQSRKQRTEIKDAIKWQADQISESGSIVHSVATALSIFANSVDIPSMVDEKLVKNMEDPEKVGCEGEGCVGGVIDLTPLFGYGCWCFFGNLDSTLGRGPPLDQYDAICQKLALCYRCIFVDAEAESDDSCDPFTVEFVATLNLGGFGNTGVSNVTSTCQTDNQVNCAWRTCACSMTMITSFFNLAFDSSSTFDDALDHQNGFDYNLECPQQGRAVDRQCCGFYPGRRTYDRGEARDCCFSRTIFNPLRHICCDDGTHVGLGNQCN